MVTMSYFCLFQKYFFIFPDRLLSIAKEFSTTILLLVIPLLCRSLFAHISFLSGLSVERLRGYIVVLNPFAKRHSLVFRKTPIGSASTTLCLVLRSADGCQANCFRKIEISKTLSCKCLLLHVHILTRMTNISIFK